MEKITAQWENALPILEHKLNVEPLQQQNLAQHPKHVGKQQTQVMQQRHVLSSNVHRQQIP